MKNFRFYTLLYIDTERVAGSVNGIKGDFEKQIKTYIRCCEALAKSLTFFTSSELTVLTNQKDYIERNSAGLSVVEIPFSLKIPRDVEFYSAHYKIDVINYFKSRDDMGEYAILIDNDVLCLNPIPQNLQNCIENNIPVFYNVTSQRYPAWGRERLIKDKEILMSGESSLGIWAGGELIGGDHSFFEALADEIKQRQEVYFENYKSFHHQGDEVLVSVAIESLLRKGVYLCDVGSFGGISRFWSQPTRHVQNRWKAFESNFLIHLPADKMYISQIKKIDERLKTRVGRYLAVKRLDNRLRYIIRKLIGKQ
jgi:hypothetical protein